MGVVNIFLLIQLHKKSKIPGQRHEMKNEMRVLVIVLLVFEFAYLFRFIADLLPNIGPDFSFNCFPRVKKLPECPNAPFYWLVMEDASFIFEGMSYLALLVFHYRNF